MPTVATAARTPSRVSGSPPATMPCAAWLQSGWARKPETMYVTKIALSASRTCSTLRKLPFRTSALTATAATGTVM